jgi:hypothetical protein
VAGGVKTPSPRALLQRLPPTATGRPSDAAMSPQRRFDCAHYDDCLDAAVHASWPSWSCEGCEAFEGASIERLAHDVAGLLQIWAEATGESVIDGPGVSGVRPRHNARGLPR